MDDFDYLFEEDDIDPDADLNDPDDVAAHQKEAEKAARQLEKATKEAAKQAEKEEAARKKLAEQAEREARSAELHAKRIEKLNIEIELLKQRQQRNLEKDASKDSDKASKDSDKASRDADKASRDAERASSERARNKNRGAGILINSFSNVATKGLSSLPSELNNISEAASLLGGLSGGASQALLGASLNLNLLVSGIIALTKITLKARDNTYSYAVSLERMGESMGSLERGAIASTNSINKLKNRWAFVMQTLGKALEPVVDIALRLLDAVTSFIPDDELDSKVAGVQAGIVNSAQQSGFSLSSSKALEGGTYTAAMKLAEKYGKQASEVAQQLADAWLTGSDAAKEYGIVVNDNVLTGYLASKGIDIANVQVSDAMLQYYRYQLLLEQINSSNRDSMQDLIKQWTQLGSIIDKTKGKLFSFDEVINLEAFDSHIPDISGGLVGEGGSSGGSSGAPIKPSLPVTPPITGTIDPGLSTELVTQLVPNLQLALDLATQLNALGVNVPVEIPQLDLVAELAKQLGLVPSKLPVQVGVDVPVGDLDKLNSLKNNLETVPANTSAGVSIEIPSGDLKDLSDAKSNLETFPSSIEAKVGVTVTNKTAVDALKESIGLVAKNWLTTLAVTMPGAGVVYSAYSIISELAKSWGVDVDIKTVGLNLLSEAQNMLQSVASLVSSIGGGIKQKVSSVASSEANKISTNLGYFKTGFKEYIKHPIKNFGSFMAEGKHYLKENHPIINAGLDTMGLAGTAMVGAGVGNLVAPAVNSGLSSLAGKASGFAAGLSSSSGTLIPSVIPKNNFYGFADGGIGTKEVHGATLFEGNKREAVIPLESQSGIKYLSDALQMAGGLSGGSIGSSITINLTLSGINIADNDAEWERVGNKIAEVIDIQNQRRGSLNYGGAF